MGETPHSPNLFVWRDGSAVEAPPEDLEVARAYHDFPAKGPVISGVRLTLLTRRARYRVGEAVRVIHVVDLVEPGRWAYVAGPKPVYGEFVDERAVTPAPPDNPLEPAIYNGPTLPSPAVDYNYEITSYLFADPGQHSIEWRLGELRSNQLTIYVLP